MNQDQLNSLKCLFIDTETSGFITDKRTFDDPQQAWIVQLGFIHSTSSSIIAEGNFLINATIKLNKIKEVSYIRQQNPEAQAIHGIDTAETLNAPMEADIMRFFYRYVLLSDLVVAHNYAFDSKFIAQALLRTDSEWGSKQFLAKPWIDTKKSGTSLCGLLNVKGHSKPPKLTELYEHLFDQKFAQTHGALSDATALRYCFYEMVSRGCFSTFELPEDQNECSKEAL